MFDFPPQALLYDYPLINIAFQLFIIIFLIIYYIYLYLVYKNEFYPPDVKDEHKEKLFRKPLLFYTKYLKKIMI